MTAPTSILDLPQAQDVFNYILARLADWQRVPARVALAKREAARLAGEARAAQDPRRIATLTLLTQSLDGTAQEFATSSGQLAAVLDAVRAAQVGQSVSGAILGDAGRLATTITVGLAGLRQTESALQSYGANLTPGPGGALIPTWVKWAAVGLGVWWFYRRVR